MSRATEVFSAWGNSMQGIFITWGNTASSATGDPATAELKIDLDVRLYGLGDTILTNNLAATDDSIQVYWLIQNPHDKAEYDQADAAGADTVYYNGWVNGAFDGGLVTYKFVKDSTTAAGSDQDANKNTVTIPYDAAENDFAIDITCHSSLIEDGVYDSTNCFSDKDAGSVFQGNEDLTVTPPTSQNFCTETWTVVRRAWVGTEGSKTPENYSEQKCVRIQTELTRKFETGDNEGIDTATASAPDIDLQYRKYSISTGWVVTLSGTDADAVPGLQKFPPIDVDFGKFLEAPEIFTGALSGLQVAIPAVLLGILSVLF